MRHRLVLLFFFILSICLASVSQAAPAGESFAFTVIGPEAIADDVALVESLGHARAINASFAVLQGVRARWEPCHNKAYQRRSQLMDEGHLPVILSLGALDWAFCRNEAGQSLAQDRLFFIREFLLGEALYQHAKGLPIVQQSASAMFRPYAENMRWEINGILFATLNVPANNNHYLSAAGRNNEFEDRLVANRHWLRRVFNHAKYHHLKAVVLFTDANPMVVPPRSNRRIRRDGFAETRDYLSRLVAQYPGKVLLIHAEHAGRNIQWRRNFGVVGSGKKKSLDITVTPGKRVHFLLKRLMPVDVED